MNYEELIRKERPLVQCITNIVTVNDCANILLSAGATAIMAHHPAEVAEIQRGSRALVCNEGATDDFEAMRLAYLEAIADGHPIVIDPVGVGGSIFRREFFFSLMELGKPSAIRGNYAEILALWKQASTVTGVDGNLEGGDTIAIQEEATKNLALKYDTIVISSGAVDIISDGKTVYKNTFGDEMMSRITGSGCMSSALLGAYLACDCSIDSAIACVIRICKAGEEASKRTREMQAGTMTFKNFFIDEIYVRS